MSSQPIKKQKKTIVLVGLMGAGKSSVGRILAAKLDLPFIDSDDEVETAAGCSIEDIFEIYGEPAFRDVEERVIDRLLNGPPMVLSPAHPCAHRRGRDQRLAARRSGDSGAPHQTAGRRATVAQGHGSDGETEAIDK